VEQDEFMKKVIVTGGCGFIGSHLVDELLSRGYSVRILSRPKCGMVNVQHVKDKVEHIDCDITDYSSIEAAVDSDVDGILHLAALINVDESREKPLAFLDTNVRGTMNLLEVARKKGIGKFLHMSTCEVYGNIPDGRANEEHLPNPRSPYAASKFAAERYVLSYAYTFENPKITIIRGFNQYGPRQHSGKWGAVIPKFITTVLRGGKIKIFGDGSQTRDYVFVKDTVRGIVDAYEKSLENGEVINLATGVETSIKDIAEKVCNILNKSQSDVVEYSEGRPGELVRSCGSSSKAKKLLGWEPSVSFDDGLKKTIDWFKENIDKLE
jgi:UDP-glucose 4-epimerase